jgi:hypothetical protein
MMLLLCCFLQLVQPELSREVSRDSVELSGRVEVLLVVRGGAPLRVELGTPLLEDESEQVWQAVRVGRASIEKLPDGLEQWKQRITLEPFIVGDSLTVILKPGKVWSGAEAEPREYRWEPINLKVASSVKPDLSLLRPPSDWDDGPQPVRSGSVRRWWLALPFGILVIILLARRRLLKRTKQPATPDEEFRQVLQELLSATLAKTVEQLPRALRRWIAAVSQVEIKGLATEELLALLQDREAWQQSIQDLKDVLDTCDRVKFTGALLPEEQRIELLKICERVVQLLESRARTTHS